MMSRGWFWVPFLLVAAAAASWGLYAALAPPPPPRGLLYANGHIEGTEVGVSAEIGGRVVESRLVEGRRVSAGDLLVELEADEPEARLAQVRAEADVVEAEAEVLRQQRAVWQHHLQTALRDLQRVEAAVGEEAATEREADRIRDRHREAEGRVFPLMFLSGTLVPVEAMPRPLQHLSLLSPLRHYMDIILGVFLKGADLTELWPQTVALVLLGTVLFCLSGAVFRRALA